MVYVGSLDTRETKRLVQASSRVMYAPPGYLLYVREGALLAHPFDAASLSLTGEQITIAEHVGNFSATGNAYFSVSANGEVLAYQSGGNTSRLVWLNRSGAEEGAVGSPGEYFLPRLSPDGQRLAVDIIDSRDGANDIWINDLARATFTRFTFTPGLENGSVWSPDGRRIVYAHDKDGPPHLFLKALGDPGQGEVLLPPGSAPQQPLDWSPDGKFLIYRAIFPQTRADLLILPMTGERKPFPFVQTPFGESEARFSPDGKWVAYVTDESGRLEVYVQRFQGGGERYQISNAGGRSPRWRRDGRELLYLAADQKLMAVAVKVGDNFEAGTPMALFSVQARNAEFDITPDGQRFLVNTIAGTPSRPLTVATNWMANLKQ